MKFGPAPGHILDHAGAAVCEVFEFRVLDPMPGQYPACQVVAHIDLLDIMERADQRLPLTVSAGGRTFRVQVTKSGVHPSDPSWAVAQGLVVA